MPEIKFLEQENLIQICRDKRQEVDDGKCTEIKLPSGLIEIPSLFFSHCEKLEKITIPSSVITIDSHAFLRCKSLKEVIFESDSKLQHIRH